tara:strand:- start:410 stop:2545 length:2136 start_codon:yes stop_codon:yes gene_type:complete
MAEYTNDLRIKEIGIGEEAGAWGTTLNTQLGLLAEGFSYGVENLGSDANATITMADGASDEARSLYLKITSTSLSATRTVTLAPQSVSKVWIIENATTGSQSITITQGEGQHGVTIPNGQVKVVYSTGDSESPSGVYDAFTDLNVEGITSTAAANTFGATSFNDADITNVGSISLDSIVSDASPAAITVGHGPADTLTINGLTTMTTDGNGNTLTLTSTDADASFGPRLKLFRNSASAADGDAIGFLNFTGTNDAGTPEEVGYAALDARIADASDGSEDGRLEMVTLLAGVEGVSRILMDATETAFNDNSKDLDFRVESDGNTHALFVQGSDGIIGLGTSTPSVPVSRFGGSAVGLAVTGGQPVVAVESTGSPGSHVGYFGQVDDDTYVGAVGGGNLFVQTGTAGTTKMTVEAGGNVGIGTSSPATKLDIFGSVNGDHATFSGTAGRGLKLSTGSRSGQNDGDAIVESQDTEGTGGRLIFRTAGNDIMLIENNGTVEFNTGTSSPSQQLALKHLGTYSGFGPQTSDGNDNHAIGLEGGGVGTGSNSRGGGIWLYGNEAAHPGDAIIQLGQAGQFELYGGTGATEYMRVQSDGNIRIGGSNFSNVTGGMHSLTLADDASYILSESGVGTGGAAILCVYEQGSGDNAIFHVGYNGAAIISTANNSYGFAVADTDGKYCVTKSAHVITFKNRGGGSRTFNIAAYGAGNTNWNTS